MKILRRMFCFQIHDWKHVFWLSGVMIREFILGYFDSSCEAALFLRLHFLCDSKKIKKEGL